MAAAARADGELMECDICGDRRHIVLPVRCTVSPARGVEPLSVRESAREYPCPQCGGCAPVENLSVHAAISEAVADIDDADYLRHVYRAAAQQMLDALLRSGHIQVERYPIDKHRRTFAVRCTLGVVAKQHIASLEERIAERQEAIAREVVEIAKAGIKHWGSFYGHTTVDKAQACQAVDEALPRVLKRRGEWRKVQNPA